MFRAKAQRNKTFVSKSLWKKTNCFQEQTTSENLQKYEPIKKTTKSKSCSKFT